MKNIFEAQWLLLEDCNGDKLGRYMKIELQNAIFVVISSTTDLLEKNSLHHKPSHLHMTLAASLHHQPSHLHLQITLAASLQHQISHLHLQLSQIKGRTYHPRDSLEQDKSPIAMKLGASFTRNRQYLSILHS